MNTQLIPVVPAAIGNQTVQTVDGRALHVFLAVPTEFSKWIERRIEEYGFEEDKDFSSFLAKSTGGRPTKEYALTLNMGKELAMVERTEIGKQARRYFIECERIALQSVSLPSHDLSVIESSLVLDFQGIPVRFLIDSSGEWMATYADVATALGFVNKEQQYNARNILKYTVKAGQRQLKHPLYGDLINLAGLDRMMAQFARNAVCEPERAVLAESLKGWLAQVAAPLVAQPASAGFLLSQQGVSRVTGQRALAYDPDYQQSAHLLTLWHEAIGESPYRAADVLTLATGHLKKALADVARNRWFSSLFSTKRLGKWLSLRQGQVVDGLVISSIYDRCRKIRLWSVGKVAP